MFKKIFVCSLIVVSSFISRPVHAVQPLGLIPATAGGIAGGYVGGVLGVGAGMVLGLTSDLMHSGGKKKNGRNTGTIIGTIGFPVGGMVGANFGASLFGYKKGMFGVMFLTSAAGTVGSYYAWQKYGNRKSLQQFFVYAAAGSGFGAALGWLFTSGGGSGSSASIEEGPSGLVQVDKKGMHLADPQAVIVLGANDDNLVHINAFNLRF